MRLLLRCDAGPSTGVGHAVRCAAIAEAALAAGHDVFWSGRLDGLDWLWAGLAGGVLPGTVLAPADTADELVAICREHRIDAVHVDHYLLGPELRDALNPHGVALSNVEDYHTGRRPADVVVDPNLGADAVPRPDDGSPVLLRGPRFAPLRRSVRRARDQRSTTPTHDLPRVLVVMGGTDAAGLLGRVIDAIATTDVPADIDVVVPIGRELTVPYGFRTVAPMPDLPVVAADVDLVVSAAGTTVWELCCVGVAMALVQAADNQTLGYRAVTASGLAAGLGTADDLSSATDVLNYLLSEPNARAEFAARARNVVDGRGAVRVLDALLNVTDLGGTLDTRVATMADAELLLSWRNDPATRHRSRTSHLIHPTQHRAWLKRSLASDTRILLIVENAGSPVGTVRWDQEDESWEVSITVAPEWRGAGLAGPVLAAGERALWATNSGKASAIAVVHRDNLASVRLFTRAGYIPYGDQTNDGFNKYRKDLRSPESVFL